MINASYKMLKSVKFYKQEEWEVSVNLRCHEGV